MQTQLLEQRVKELEDQLRRQGSSASSSIKTRRASSPSSSTAFEDSFDASPAAESPSAASSSTFALASSSNNTDSPRPRLVLLEAENDRLRAALESEQRHSASLRLRLDALEGKFGALETALKGLSAAPSQIKREEMETDMTNDHSQVPTVNDDSTSRSSSSSMTTTFAGSRLVAREVAISSLQRKSPRVVVMSNSSSLPSLSSSPRSAPAPRTMHELLASIKVTPTPSTPTTRRPSQSLTFGQTGRRLSAMAQTTARSSRLPSSNSRTRACLTLTRRSLPLKISTAAPSALMTSSATRSPCSTSTASSRQQQQRRRLSRFRRSRLRPEHW